MGGERDYELERLIARRKKARRRPAWQPALAVVLLAGVAVVAGRAALRSAGEKPAGGAVAEPQPAAAKKGDRLTATGRVKLLTVNAVDAVDALAEKAGQWREIVTIATPRGTEFFCQFPDGSRPAAKLRGLPSSADVSIRGTFQTIDALGRAVLTDCELLTPR